MQLHKTVPLFNCWHEFYNLQGNDSIVDTVYKYSFSLSFDEKQMPDSK